MDCSTVKYCSGESYFQFKLLQSITPLCKDETLNKRGVCRFGLAPSHLIHHITAMI